jgi:hypothetical protein
MNARRLIRPPHRQARGAWEACSHPKRRKERGAGNSNELPPFHPITSPDDWTGQHPPKAPPDQAGMKNGGGGSSALAPVQATGGPPVVSTVDRQATPTSSLRKHLSRPLPLGGNGGRTARGDCALPAISQSPSQEGSRSPRTASASGTLTPSRVQNDGKHQHHNRPNDPPEARPTTGRAPGAPGALCHSRRGCQKENKT